MHDKTTRDNSEAMSWYSSPGVPFPICSSSTAYSPTNIPSPAQDPEQIAVADDPMCHNSMGILDHPNDASLHEIQKHTISLLQSINGYGTGQGVEVMDVETEIVEILQQPASIEASSSLAVQSSYGMQPAFSVFPNMMHGPTQMERFNFQLFMNWHEENRINRTWGSYETFADTKQVSDRFSRDVSYFFGTQCRLLAEKVS
jgi:hypothetical protein